MNPVLFIILFVAFGLFLLFLLSCYIDWQNNRHHKKNLPALPRLEPKPNAGEGVKITRPFGGNTTL